jgi:hypothetical protein
MHGLVYYDLYCPYRDLQTVIRNIIGHTSINYNVSVRVAPTRCQTRPGPTTRRVRDVLDRRPAPRLAAITHGN